VKITAAILLLALLTACTGKLPPAPTLVALTNTPLVSTGDQPVAPTPLTPTPVAPTSTLRASASDQPVAGQGEQTVAPTLLAPITWRCSPLEGVPLAELNDRIVNPFAPPPRGSDDPHQGIDLADFRTADRIALEGLPVHAVLAGRVAMVLANRFPYGNAILIETPLDRLPSDLREGLPIPEMLPPPEKLSALTCPPLETPLPAWETEPLSVYTLYAHLKEPPNFQPGEAITCGQPLGAIGNSGNALNPHLHLEMRLGPPGIHLGSLAHYDTSATPKEMAAYCTWRLGEPFWLIDPGIVVFWP
jgi:murein DD-endopeptidase MepM/ murein hydrolase activator NlpD